MKKTLVSAVKIDGKGVLVTFNGSEADCLEAVGIILASVVDNMAQSGAPMEYIRKRIGACVDYGMRRGLERTEEAPE